MNEKLFDSILTNSKEQILKTISVLLWISVFFVSYNKFINTLDYKTLISAEGFTDYFLSGNYVVLIGWFICLVVCYYYLKYLLTIIIPSSAVGTKIFINYLVPEEYKVSILNVYYKKAINVSEEHVKKILKFWDDNSLENNLKNKEKLKVITGILIKFLMILLITINDFSGIEFYILLISIIICFTLLMLMILSITSVTGKNLIHKLVEVID